jgi:threonine dehydratase
MLNPINKDTIIETHQCIEAHIHFKCENFQKVGAFKSRGARITDFSAYIVIPNGNVDLDVFFNNFEI